MEWLSRVFQICNTEYFLVLGKIGRFNKSDPHVPKDHNNSHRKQYIETLDSMFFGL